MQHAFTTPDYPAHWDDEDADPIECVMVFIYEGNVYRVYGEWMPDAQDFDGTAKAFLLDDDGDELEEINTHEFWEAAAYARVKERYEDLEEIK